MQLSLKKTYMVRVKLNLFLLGIDLSRSPCVPSIESESASDTGTDSLTWISWFCSLPGHEYFAEVSEDFIEDDFNLTGLNALVPFYKEALEMILDVEPRKLRFQVVVCR